MNTVFLVLVLCAVILAIILVLFGIFLVCKRDDGNAETTIKISNKGPGIKTRNIGVVIIFLGIIFFWLSASVYITTNKLHTMTTQLNEYKMINASFVHQLANAGNKITVAGKLEQATFPGTTSKIWAVRLGTPIELKGKKISTVSIALPPNDIEKFDRKYIEMIGVPVTSTSGIQRGLVAVSPLSIREQSIQ